jgi:uncharacterized protein (DUF1697 family)
VRLGFGDVSTYINSGNVLFRSPTRNARAIEGRIDRMLNREYGLVGKTVVRSYEEMATLMKRIATEWTHDPEARRSVVFLRHAIDSTEVLDGLNLNSEVERVVYCPGTLLWSAQVSDLTRTAMVKLASRPIYREMTVRNVNTTTKVFALMQRMVQQS